MCSGEGSAACLIEEPGQCLSEAQGECLSEAQGECLYEAQGECLRVAPGCGALRDDRRSAQACTSRSWRLSYSFSLGGMLL